MEGFIYAWLNELLRDENWEEINVLTPYLVCLIYTFLLPDYILELEKSQGLGKVLRFFRKPTLALYRGTALTEQQLGYYDPKKVTYFSWNAVTSTSRAKEQAEKFIGFVMKNAAEVGETRIKILIKIETDYASVEDCEGMIDVAKYSQKIMKRKLF